ncbi:MAG TPA: arsenate reductase (glutaredoxin) [Paracoccaceae bacterium]|nr:arsenate reductase (glutaredoxin) [Paracoccaceae bacterium]
MSVVTIWHNPRCSKSRQTLALLIDNGVDPVIREYLTDVPSVTELKKALALLGKSASELLRKGEAEFKELGLKDADDDAILQAMNDHPRLIERPIVFANGKAAVGRPPESVLEILG